MVINRILFAVCIVSLGLSTQSLALDEALTLPELQDKAQDILSGNQNLEVNACYSFAEYGKYYYRKREQGVSLARAKLLIRTMATKIPGSKTDRADRHTFLLLMESLGEEIYRSSFINDDNIEYALKQFCKATIQRISLKDAEATRNDD